MTDGLIIAIGFLKSETKFNAYCTNPTFCIVPSFTSNLILPFNFKVSSVFSSIKPLALPDISFFKERIFVASKSELTLLTPSLI